MPLHKLRRDGNDAHPEEIIVTNGAQRALALTAEALHRPRRPAALEAVTYPGVIDTVRQRGCGQLVALPADDTGLRVDARPPAHPPTRTRPRKSSPMHFLAALLLEHRYSDTRQWRINQLQDSLTALTKAVSAADLDWRYQPLLEVRACGFDFLDLRPVPTPTKRPATASLSQSAAPSPSQE
jgi:hypothetical protein